MTLPKIVTPTYELEIPSSKEKITYRPFLVKEEKILLLAQEAEKDSEMLLALKQIINNCTYEKVEVEKLPMFDLEYIFLQIRAKSVGEVVDLKLLCEDDGETYADVQVNLDEVDVEFTEGHSNSIQLTDEVGIIMSYPQINMMDLSSDSGTENVFGIIKNSINQITEGETVYERADFTEKDINEFLDSLTTEHFKLIQEFFETMPRLRHEVKFKNPKTKKQNKITLEGLNSFF
jgi:hypothetical protein